MTTNERIAEQVEAVYRWIETQIEATGAHPQPCKSCGQCCDFKGYDHRLYVTSAELTHFLTRTSRDIAEPTGPCCPFNVDGVCTVHQWRFAGCRIFLCSGDAEAQAQISEEAVRRLKSICLENNLEYRYVNLMHAAD